MNEIANNIYKASLVPVVIKTWSGEIFSYKEAISYLKSSLPLLGESASEILLRQ